MANKIHIIGMGENGALDNTAKSVLANCTAVFSSKRLLDKIELNNIENFSGEKITWQKPFKSNIEIINDTYGDVVILATGDPSYFGVAKIILTFFVNEDVIIYPHAGAFSYVSARMGWATEDCACITIHGRSNYNVLLHTNQGRKIIALSHNGNTPAEIGKLLSDYGFGKSTITVLENLSGEGETITTHTANELQSLDNTSDSFDDLNCLAIECVGSGYSLSSGLPDDAFIHDGQLTKREVRSASLSALQPKHNEILWDIGAGSGAISIEWARLGGISHAIEKNSTRSKNILDNANNLGVPDISIHTDDALAVIDKLEMPNAVFIGGGITNIDMVKSCIDALPVGGRLVANTITIEGEAILTSLYNQYGGEMCRISVDRLCPVGGFSGWKPLMPVTQYILTIAISKDKAQ